MKIIAIILMKIFFLVHVCFGQDIPAPTNFNLDFHSNKHIKILDGYFIDDKENYPSNFKINRIITIDDVKKMSEFGIPVLEKPYMILSTEVSDLREYIYGLAKINPVFKGINLPIILNGQLITFEKYKILESLNKKDIIKAEWFETKKEEMGMLIPFGVITISAK